MGKAEVVGHEHIICHFLRLNNIFLPLSVPSFSQHSFICDCPGPALPFTEHLKGHSDEKEKSVSKVLRGDAKVFANERKDS